MANNYWEWGLHKEFKKPLDSGSNEEVKRFIEDKYVKRLYVLAGKLDPVNEYLLGTSKPQETHSTIIKPQNLLSVQVPVQKIAYKQPLVEPKRLEQQSIDLLDYDFDCSQKPIDVPFTTPIPSEVKTNPAPQPPSIPMKVDQVLPVMVDFSFQDKKPLVTQISAKPVVQPVNDSKVAKQQIPIDKLEKLKKYNNRIITSIPGYK